MSMTLKLTAIHVITPLAVGGLLYIGFRSTSLTMFKWFEMIGIDYATDTLRGVLQPVKKNLPSWIYYSLPDGLWVYSFSSSYLILWGQDISKLKFWLFFPLLFGSGIELLQYFEFFHGTFDIVDLLFCTAGSILSVIILNNKTKIL